MLRFFSKLCGSSDKNSDERDRFLAFDLACCLDFSIFIHSNIENHELDKNHRL